MLLVKTKIDLSNIQGIGLFANQYIKRGSIVWELDTLVDKLYDEEIFDLIRSPTKEALCKYSYKMGGKIIVCGDDARFINHSKHPNCIEDEKTLNSIAAYDIMSGEEITENYASFDDNFNTYADNLI